MQRTKMIVSYLLFFSLTSAICFSACEAHEAEIGSGLFTEADADHDSLAEKPTDAIERNPTLDVLNHYSHMFIASKVDSCLNLRDAPSMKGAVIGKIIKNGGGEILEDLGKWYRVQSGGMEGYVAAEYCVSEEEARKLAPSVAVKMVHITDRSVNVRSGPGLDFDILTQLGIADCVSVVEDLGEWYKIRISNFEGYISKDYAEPGWYLNEAVAFGISGKRQKLLSYAEQFIGIPYKWGGTSLDGDGIDCSSFVQQCLKNALGISLDRTAEQLSACGCEVSLSEAKPGDLMFYTDQSGKIDHVAFYIGDGRIIHASLSFGQVTVSAYNYVSKPALIKNVIGD